MRKQKLRWIVLGCLLMLVNHSVYAVAPVPIPSGADPVENARWTQMIALLTKQLKEAKDTLKSVKEHMEVAIDMKALTEGDLRNLDVFRSPTMKKYFDVSVIEGFGDTVGVIDDLGKIDQELAEVDQAYQHASGDKKIHYEQNRNFLIARRQLMMIERENKRNQMRAAKDINPRTSAQLTAGATTGMFDIIIQIEKNKQSEAAAGAQISNTVNHQISGGYRAMGSR